MTPTDIFALGRAATPSSPKDPARSGRKDEAGDTALSGSNDFERALKNDGQSAGDAAAAASRGEGKPSAAGDAVTPTANRQPFAASRGEAVLPETAPQAMADPSGEAQAPRTSESETMQGSVIIDIAGKHAGSLNEAAESAKALAPGVAKSRGAASANSRDAFQSVIADGGAPAPQDGRQAELGRDGAARRSGDAAAGQLAAGGADQMVETAGDAFAQAGGETRKSDEQARDRPPRGRQAVAEPGRAPSLADAGGEIPPEAPASLERPVGEAARETGQAVPAEPVVMRADAAAPQALAGQGRAGEESPQGGESVRARISAPASGTGTRSGAAPGQALAAPGAAPQPAVKDAARTAEVLEQAAGGSEAKADRATDTPAPVRSAQAAATPQAPQAAAATAAPAISAEAAARLGGDAPPADQVMTFESGSGSSWRLGADAMSTGSARAAEAQAGASARPQTVAQQLTFAVSTAKDGPVEVRLDPQELGRVQIQLHTSEDGVRAVIIAERAETQDLLRRHAEMLARDLNEAGFGSVTLDFASGGQAEDRRDESVSAQGRMGSSETDAALPDQIAEARPVRPRSGTGLTNLDIRL